MGGAFSAGNKKKNEVDNSVRSEIEERVRQGCKGVACQNTIKLDDIVARGQDTELVISQICDAQLQCMFERSVAEINKTLLAAETDQANTLKAPQLLTLTGNFGNRSENHIDNSVLHRRVYDALQECGVSQVGNKLEGGDVLVDEGASVEIKQVARTFYQCGLESVLDVDLDIVNETKNTQKNVDGETDWWLIVAAIVACIMVVVVVGALARRQKKQGGKQRKEVGDDDEDEKSIVDVGKKKKRNNNTKVIVLVAVVALLVIGGGSALAWHYTSTK